MYAVYKVTGMIDSVVYFGYANLEKGKNLTAHFLYSAKHICGIKTTCGATRMFELNDSDPEMIQVDLIDEFEDELEAWAARNSMRAMHTNSITGPTLMPWGITERAMEIMPEKIEEWKRATKIREAKTAREAWRLGKWADDAVKSLGNKFNKKSVIQDLDELNPAAFEMKYSL